ncbi:1895_t:CDS:2 [Funneliformis geosporum]|nr:1895_t:CDS:2 [Funneliformis geosporum]
MKKSTYFDKYGSSGKDEEQNPLDLSEKIEDLKIELKEPQKSLTMAEYTKKWAIFEYLIKLDDNGKGKMKASMESAQLVFVEGTAYKARSIRY